VLPYLSLSEEIQGSDGKIPERNMPRQVSLPGQPAEKTAEDVEDLSTSDPQPVAEPMFSPGRSRPQQDRGGSEDDASDDDGRAPSPMLSPSRRSEAHSIIGQKTIQMDSWLGQAVTSPTFEAAIAALIMANGAVMALDVQYQGLDLGYELGYRRYNVPGSSAWPACRTFLDICNMLFGVIFVLELIAKVIGMQKEWFKDAWNHFDALIVVSWFIEVFGEELPIDNSVMRMARLVKLLRLIRVARTLNGFDSLYLMTAAMKGSMAVLGWSVVLLCVIQMFVGFAFNQVLHMAYFHNSAYPIEERQEVFQYFGSFSRAMMSMFEMTLANWPPVCRLLMEYVSEWFVVFCIFHKLTIGFAVIGVVNGVFMQETFKVASTDDCVLMQQKERAMGVHMRKMMRLFKEADTSGDGTIDLDEFKEVMSNDEVKMWLSSMELEVDDANALFSLVDVNNEGELDAMTLARGIARVQGTARSIDMMTVLSELRDLRASLMEGGAAPGVPKQSAEEQKLSGG
jgi:hypothetical protein